MTQEVWHLDPEPDIQRYKDRCQEGNSVSKKKKGTRENHFRKTNKERKKKRGCTVPLSAQKREFPNYRKRKRIKLASSKIPKEGKIPSRRAPQDCRGKGKMALSRGRHVFPAG